MFSLILVVDFPEATKAKQTNGKKIVKHKGSFVHLLNQRCHKIRDQLSFNIVKNFQDNYSCHLNYLTLIMSAFYGDKSRFSTA